MFVPTASGFEGTPVTRRLVYFTIIFPLFIALLEAQYFLDLGFTPQLTEWFQWWRIPLSQAAYTSQSQVLWAILLLYNLRVLERLLGSRKYLSFLIVIYGLNIIFTPVLLAILHSVPLVRLNYIPPGQTCVLFALIGMYHRLVPVVYRFQLSPSSDFKLQFSDKSFVYLVAAQLALGSLLGSLVSAGLGWVLGGLVHSEVLPGRNWRVPVALYRALRLEEKDDNANMRRRGDRDDEGGDEADEGSDNDNGSGGGDGAEGDGNRRPLASQLLDTFRT